ncbi:hypothetical protein V2J09_007354 [Rumex salicifolius]
MNPDFPPKPPDGGLFDSDQLSKAPIRGPRHRRAQSDTLFRLPDDFLFDVFDLDLSAVGDNSNSTSATNNYNYPLDVSMAVDFGRLDCSSSRNKSASITCRPPPPTGHLRSVSVDADFFEGLSFGTAEFDGGDSGGKLAPPTVPPGEKRPGFHRRNKSMDGSSSSLEADSVIDGLKKAMTREKLAELALVDPKKAKRILSNRQSAARSKERRIQYTSELERKVQTLQTEATALSTQFTMLQRESIALTAENRELKLRLQALEQQGQLKDALNDTLKEEVQRLKIEACQIPSTKLLPSFSGFNTRASYSSLYPYPIFSRRVASAADWKIAMEASPMNNLPLDTLHVIFSNLSLRQIGVSRTVCKFLHQMLTSSSFLRLISDSQTPLSLLALRPPHQHHHQRVASSASPPSLHAFDSNSNEWLKFDLAFLPFRSVSPVTSSLGLVYLWGESPESSKSLLVCNPLTRRYRVLPQLGSAWSKHGSVLTGSSNRVLVLTELATLYYTGSNTWLKFSSNLPSKPRSPVIIQDSLYSLCDVGSPWRSQWKLFTCALPESRKSLGWTRVERHEWGDVFDILKRPRLVSGSGNNILMIGGLKSSFSLNASCSTIVILRLDLDALEWHEAARMPVDMYTCFQESNKYKVFGGGDRICFSAKRVGKLALCDCAAQAEPDGLWRWVDGSPGLADGLCRGFVFDAGLNAFRDVCNYDW